MIENDAQLIHRTLSGDETAFASLVGKYEKTGSCVCVAKD